jgi:hypothetical protein
MGSSAHRGAPRRTVASSAQCKRGTHGLREESGDDAGMLRKQPPGIWRALLCSNSDCHHRAAIGHHQRVEWREGRARGRRTADRYR